MSQPDILYPTGTTEISSPPYNSSLPLPPGRLESHRRTRCATGIRFISTIHGILNLCILVFLFCVVISAGVADRDQGIEADADTNPSPTNVKLSAFHTRNAVIVFAVMGLVLILLDTILHVTQLIYRLPEICDLIFSSWMIVFAVIYFILGCCAAAWEQKMRDKLPNDLQHKGAAASVAAFLFLTMVATLINYLLRLTIRPIQATIP